MANKLVALDGKTTKFRAIKDILKDPNLKAKLTNCVDEAVRCKLKIQQQQEAIKSIRDAAKESVGVDPKIFNYYVGMVYNNDYAMRKQNVDELSTLIDTVMALLPPDNSNRLELDDDDE